MILEYVLFKKYAVLNKRFTVVGYCHKIVNVQRKEGSVSHSEQATLWWDHSTTTLFGGMKANLVKTYPNGLKLKTDASVCHYDESTLLNIRVMPPHGSGNKVLCYVNI